MPKIRTLIAAPDPAVRSVLRAAMAVRRRFEISAECDCAHDALEAAGNLLPQVVFMAAALGEADGFRVAAAFPSPWPQLVFLVGDDPLARTTLQHYRLDHLDLPLRDDAVLRCLDVMATRAGGGVGDSARRLQALVDALPTSGGYPERLVVREDGRVTLLPVHEIEWVESAGNYVQLHTERRTHMVRETLKATEARLDPARFLRIRRSAIVNLSRVANVTPGDHGEHVVMLHNGTRISTSRTYRHRVDALLRSRTVFVTGRRRPLGPPPRACAPSLET